MLRQLASFGIRVEPIHTSDRGRTLLAREADLAVICESRSPLSATRRRKCWSGRATLKVRRRIEIPYEHAATDSAVVFDPGQIT
jgi:hypothetical protein